jgi:hypothetical protein
LGRNCHSWRCPINKIGGIAFLDFNLNPEVSYYANEEDNSGILKFVRIEYSGRKLKEQKNLMVCRLLVWE